MSRPNNRHSKAIRSVSLATNNGDIGGGEVMLLRIAGAMRALGVEPNVVAPRSPSAVADAAEAAGHTVTRLAADSRASWMYALRRWDCRTRSGLLWCNGLVPALATAGRPNRVVHLHQPPSARQRGAAWLARAGARLTLVPSAWMADLVPGTQVLANWAEPIRIERTRRPGWVQNESGQNESGQNESGQNRSGPTGPLRIGFLGRLSMDKGVLVLLEAMQLLDQQSPGEYRLLLAGAPRFVSENERIRLEQAIRAAGQVAELVGWVDRDDFLPRIDLLVVPSVAPESFGLAAVEAMAAGVPLLVSDAGALPETVGQHATVVPAGDAAALAAAIAAHADTADVARLDAARRRWLSNYSPDTGAAALATTLAGLGVAVPNG